MIKLINGDCILELEKLIPEFENKISAIIVDPPYGVLGGAEWDNIIPVDKIIKQLHLLLKPKGKLLVFGNSPFYDRTLLDFTKKYNLTEKITKNYFLYNGEMIWEKSNITNPLDANRAILRKHEKIMILRNNKLTKKDIENGEKSIYNPYTKIEQKTKNKKQITSFTNIRPGGLKNLNSKNKENLIFYTNYPTSVYFCKQDKNGIHPTQKPLNLLEHLIKLYTNEEDIVLDYTMGSGSTGLAAKLNNRSFIGIEMDENYFKICENRILNLNNDFQKYTHILKENETFEEDDENEEQLKLF